MDLYQTQVGVESKPSDETNKTFTPINRHEFNRKLNKATNDFFSSERLESIRKDFEEHWALFNYINDSVWHPEEGRYTVFSNKQTEWVTWKVSAIFAQSGKHSLMNLLDLPRDFKIA